MLSKEKDSTWDVYREAGHDIPSLTGKNYKCKDCGSHLIDLAEDLMYGDMRKCK